MDCRKIAQLSRARRRSRPGFWKLMPAGLETGHLDFIDVHGCFKVAINRQCTSLYVLTNVPHPDNPREESIYLLQLEWEVDNAASSRDLIDVLKMRAGATPQRRTTAALAAAANIRIDVAFKRLGALERQGAVTSIVVDDGELQEMAWTLRLAAWARSPKDIQIGEAP